jgi:hypothetical protein
VRGLELSEKILVMTFPGKAGDNDWTAKWFRTAILVERRTVNKR